MKDAAILLRVEAVCVNLAVLLYNGNVLLLNCAGVAVDEVVDGMIVYIAKAEVPPLFRFATRPHLMLQTHGAVNCILPSVLNFALRPLPYVATGVDCQGLDAKLNPTFVTVVPILTLVVGFVWI